MHYFLSAGEPSGDHHGKLLIEAIKRRDPSARITGFGGAEMASVGAELLDPLAERPIIMTSSVSSLFVEVPRVLALLRKAEQFLKDERPDAVILIDYPGFNVRLAERAKRMGTPVIYFVPPQLWAWAQWRVKRFRRVCDLFLCSLPFEPTWFKSKGVARAEYIGHPFFDVPTPAAPALSQQPTVKQVLLLPGSRPSELKWNLPTLAECAALISQQAPETTFIAAGLKEAHRTQIEDAFRDCPAKVDIWIGRTREAMTTASAAIAVSGSVSLELMDFQVPTVIIYRVSLFLSRVVAPLLMKSPYITLVNLLAGRAIFPEFHGDRIDTQAIAHHVLTWLGNDEKRSRIRGELALLKRYYGQAGATSRAADRILEFLGEQLAPHVRVGEPLGEASNLRRSA